MSCIDNGAAPAATGADAHLLNNSRKSITYTGLLRYIWAVANSSLDSTNKAVLYGLSPHLDWQEWTCHPSIARIAGNASLSARAVQGALNRLHQMRVVLYDRRSKGRGCHHLRVDVAKLESLANPEPRSGLNPAPSGDQPRTTCAVTPQAVHCNPELRAGRHTTEQTNQQATTTTTLAGGGGGGDSGFWAERLIIAGVNRHEAEALSQLPGMSGALVAFAIDAAKRPGVNRPGRLIACLLRKPPEELDGFDRFYTKRVHRHQLILQKAIEDARNWALPEAAKRINAAFANTLEMLTSGAVPEAVLCAESPDPRQIFSALLRAADRAPVAPDFPPADAGPSVRSSEEGR